mmetsp:Transcript_122421/g.341537  ORF Transcript_122421/g.341537 Transcript_122421/m.341537 type:complete len:306 (-) Transcript_122421:631-1548(-)
MRAKRFSAPMSAARLCGPCGPSGLACRSLPAPGPLALRVAPCDAQTAGATGEVSGGTRAEARGASCPPASGSALLGGSSGTGAARGVSRAPCPRGGASTSRSHSASLGAAGASKATCSGTTPDSQASPKAGASASKDAQAPAPSPQAAKPAPEVAQGSGAASAAPASDGSTEKASPPLATCPSVPPSGWKSSSGSESPQAPSLSASVRSEVESLSKSLISSKTKSVLSPGLDPVWNDISTTPLEAKCRSPSGIPPPSCSPCCLSLFWTTGRTTSDQPPAANTAPHSGTFAQKSRISQHMACRWPM